MASEAQRTAARGGSCASVVPALSARHDPAPGARLLAVDFATSTTVTQLSLSDAKLVFGDSSATLYRYSLGELP